MPLESSGTEAFVCLFVCMCVCLQKAAYYRGFNPEAGYYPASWGAAQGQTDLMISITAGPKLPSFFLTVPLVIWNVTSLARDGTHIPCTGSVESYPLAHQGNTRIHLLMTPDLQLQPYVSQELRNEIAKHLKVAATLAWLAP